MALLLDSSPSLVWTLDMHRNVAAAEVDVVPGGVEVRFLRNGTPLFSQIFATGEDALREAEEEHMRMIAHGWAHAEVH
jgi:hypothetical protein